MKGFITSKDEHKKTKTTKALNPSYRLRHENIYIEKHEEYKKSEISSSLYQLENPSNVEISHFHDVEESQVSLENFPIQKVLARGTYGDVFLVKDRDTEEPLAMRSLRKDALI